LLSIQPHENGKKKITVNVEFNQPLESGIFTLRPIDTLDGTQDADFIISSTYE
jgi:hypothetical protein